MTGNTFKTFITAGNAIFTAVSRKTGNRFTYRVRLSDDRKVFFVSVLCGPDNTSNYRFIGTLRDGRYTHGKRSEISAHAPSVLAFRWVWEHVAIGAEVPSTDLHHCGKCGRCGRALTVPQSILTGLGPDCAQIMGLSFNRNVPADILNKQARIDAERAAGYDA